jgi:MFS family permease
MTMPSAARPPSPTLLLAAGVATLALAMGFGRFAYTPLLPPMRADAGLTVALAGIVATANLAGYLVGALAASGSWARARRVAIVRWSVVAGVAATGLMGLHSVPVWLAARFAAGVASGLAFVLISSLVLDRAARDGRRQWPAVLYAGVGAGIALSGLLVPPFVSWGGSRGGWLGLCAVSAVIAAIVLPWLHDTAPAPAAGAATAARPAGRSLFWWLFAAYGGEGFGYIIPATFMVANISAAPALARYAGASWVVVGLVAIPSTLLWNAVGLRIGRAPALAVAMLVQAAGAAAPQYAPNAAGAMIAAVTLGATFMGVTALGSALARELYPESSHTAIGALTAIFGIGQAIGPSFAAVLTVRTGTYGGAIVASAVVLAVSGCAMLLGAGLAGRRAVLSRARPVPESRAGR